MKRIFHRSDPTAVRPRETVVCRAARDRGRHPSLRERAPAPPQSLTRFVSLLLVSLATIGTSTGCSKPSVLVVGLDGANWAILDPLIDAGHVPTIGGLVQNGARADMSCVPADPNFPCFCPPSWTSIATGQPVSEHRITGLETPSDSRGVAAIWNVASDQGALVTLSSWRGTWPPEPGIDYVFTEPGLDAVGEEMYESWQLIDHVGRDQPDTLFQPEALPELLGILPHVDERPPSWAIFSRDRAAMTGLLELVLRLRGVTETEPRAELTMIILHGPDKVEHLMWGGMQEAAGAPIETDVLLAAAESWDGPIEEPAPFGWGHLAGPYLEADAWLSQLLSARSYDYIVFVSDHGMARRDTGFPGDHSELSPDAHDGIFSVTGPGVVPGAWLGQITVLDVAPTLAYLLGMPVAADLPGRVLTEAFTAEHLSLLPILTTPSWD